MNIEYPNLATVHLTNDQAYTLMEILNETMVANAREGFKEYNPFIQRIHTKIASATAEMQSRVQLAAQSNS